MIEASRKYGFTVHGFLNQLKAVTCIVDCPFCNIFFASELFEYVDRVEYY